MDRLKRPKMTVKELREALAKFDPNMTVEVYASYNSGRAGAGGTVQQISVEEDTENPKGKVVLNNYDI